MESLKEVLMNKFDISAKEAQKEINNAKEIMHSYIDGDDQESAYEICGELWGLEPDYIMDLL